MSAFSDQFDRVNPFQFDPVGPLSTVVSLLLLDAKSYLVRNRDVEVCKAICQIIESEFKHRIKHQEHRLNFLVGEFNLLQMDLSEEAEPLCTGLLEAVKPWEVYAMLAMWKLVDVCDIFNGRSQLDEFDDHEQWDAANENLAVAYKALQIAASIVGNRISGARVRKDVAKRKSDQGRVNIAPRWGSRPMHIEFALSLVPAFKTQFRIESARKITKAVNAKFGKTYRDSSIDRWLEAAGWVTPNILTGG